MYKILSVIREVSITKKEYPITQNRSQLVRETRSIYALLIPRILGIYFTRVQTNWDQDPKLGTEKYLQYISTGTTKILIRIDKNQKF
jgi:hypothetical protein